MCEDVDYSILFPKRYTNEDPDYAKCSIDLPPPPVVRPWPPQRSNRGRGRNNSFRRNDQYRHSYHGEDRNYRNDNYRGGYHDRSNRNYDRNRYNGPYHDQGHRDRHYDRGPDYRDSRDNRDSRDYRNNRDRREYHDNRDERYRGDYRREKDDRRRVEWRNSYHGDGYRQDDHQNSDSGKISYDSADRSVNVNEQQI